MLKKPFSKKHKSLSIDAAQAARSQRTGGESSKQPFSGHNSIANSGKVSPPAIKFPKLSKQQDFLNSPIALTSDHQTFTIPADPKPQTNPIQRKNAYLRETLSERRSANSLLLSDYKFGNPKIYLTIDGGQNLKSEDDEEIPPITSKKIQQIFNDPVFDHKQHVERIEQSNRERLLGRLVQSIKQRQEQLESPANFKEFYHSNDLGLCGFGTK